MKKFLLFLCGMGIHIRRTKFREHGRLVGACKTCYTEWDKGTYR